MTAPRDHLDTLYRSPAGVLLRQSLSQARAEAQNPRSTPWERKAAVAVYDALLVMAGNLRSTFSALSYEMADEEMADELRDHIDAAMNPPPPERRAWTPRIVGGADFRITKPGDVRRWVENHFGGGDAA